MATAAELRSLLAEVDFRDAVALSYGGASVRTLFGFPTIDFSSAADPGNAWQEYFAPVFREQEREMAEFHQQYFENRAALIGDAPLPDLAVVGPPRPNQVSPAPKRRPHTVTRA